MAQHDQVIDNAAGNVVRADLNAALAALFSSNSGTTAPTTTTPGLTWFDTTTNTLYIRNAANTAWIDLTASIGATVVAAAAAFAADNRLLRSDGVSRGAQASGVTLSDLNDISGARNLSITGDLDIAGSMTLASMVLNSLQLSSTDDTANAGPILDMRRLSGSPANGDFGPQISMFGRDSAGSTVLYGAQRVQLTGIAAASRYSRMDFIIAAIGATMTPMQLIGSATDSGEAYVNVGNPGTVGVGSGDSNGVKMQYNGRTIIRANSGPPLTLAAPGSPSTLIHIYQPPNIIAQVQNNAGTVTWGNFLGSHITQWARSFEPKTKPRRGTIIETVDEICEWFMVVYEYEGERFEVGSAEGALPDDAREGQVVPFKHKVRRMAKKRAEIEVQVEEEQDVPTIEFDGDKAVVVMRPRMVKVFDPVPLYGPDGEPVMQRLRIEDDPTPVVVQKPRMKTIEEVSEVEEVVEVDVEATVVLVGEEHLPRCRIAEPGSMRVYGGYVDSDGDPAHPRDFNVAAIGAYVVLMHPSTKGQVEGGDLVFAGPDGMAITEKMVVEAGDFTHLSGIVAKITSTVPIDLYDDGAYSLSCTYQAG